MMRKLDSKYVFRVIKDLVDAAGEIEGLASTVGTSSANAEFREYTGDLIAMLDDRVGVACTILYEVLEDSMSEDGDEYQA
jgi:hypothetical protein